MAVLAVPLVSGGVTDSRPSEGIRDRAPEFHAITGLEIVLGPGKRISEGTIIVREDVIEDVRSGRVVPEGAREWDRSGRIAYPGFIDAYGEGSAEPDQNSDTLYWNRHIRPGVRPSLAEARDKSLNEKLQQVGVLLRLVAPPDGIALWFQRNPVTSLPGMLLSICGLPFPILATAITTRIRRWEPSL